MASMGIRLLGPTELRAADGHVVEVPGAKRRAVLALLALELGRVVPLTRFFELLWGSELPAHAKTALQGHVAALRRAFTGTPFTLVTQAPGYQLNGPADAVDALRFAELIHRSAESGDDRVSAAVLLEALNLWSGAALADLPDTELRRALAQQLDDAHADAVIAWAECSLRQGLGASAVPVLEQCVLADGLREPAIALLMRCLQQAGRSADAVNVYNHARARLRNELGISPGPALAEAFAAVLGSGLPTAAAKPASPAPRRVPNLLPRRPTAFVGRVEESQWLDRECGAQRGGGGLSLVVGPAGTGKTSTVIRWAHTMAAAFPDGQLFVDMRGFAPSDPMTPGEVLGRFLQALGVAEGEIPEDPDTRADLYREHTAHRQLLVILDNVRTAADITDLLPSGADCVTVVTSRNSLEDLVVSEGASLLRIDALSVEDSLDLLEQLLTPDRVRAERAAAQRLVVLCGRLPLALRVAAARLSGSPQWAIADLVVELEDERTRLLTLDTRGEINLRSALTLTHSHLPLRASQLLAQLAAHPAMEVDSYAAAALLGTEAAEARQALGALAAYHLLSESAPGRYSRHDLIRLYGAELLAEQGPAEQRAAGARIHDYYLAALRVAVLNLNPYAELPEGPRYLPRSLPRLADVHAAIYWFRAEQPAIHALVVRGAERGEHERAWRIAQLSDVMYHSAGQVVDRVACMRAGLKAAQRSGAAAAVTRLRTALAGALNGAGRPVEALALATQALDQVPASDAGARIGALGTLATIKAGQGELAAANRLFDEAVALIRTSGRSGHATSTLANAAALKGMTGDAETALRYSRETRRLLADHPTATFHLSAMVNEAHALHALGRTDEAGELWTQTLGLCEAAGTHVRAVAERQYAEFLLASGRRGEAASHLRTAIELFTVRGNLLVVKYLTGQLAELEAAPGAE
jgi:DNA-binding SARP family transcriptional activator/tetratricopeptide (TPR) repeat protein